MNMTKNRHRNYMIFS